MEVEQTWDTPELIVRLDHGFEALKLYRQRSLYANHTEWGVPNWSYHGGVEVKLI
jgi:hypothetical protein